MTTIPTTAPTPSTQPITSSPDPQAAVVKTANDFINNNQRFVQQNGQLAADAISSGDPKVATTIAATQTLSANVSAVNDNIQTYNSGSWWQNALGTAKNALGDVIKAIPGGHEIASWGNKGLNEISKDYKFISSIYERHGIAEGLLATLPVVAGGVIGTFIGPEGTAAGAALGATALAGLGMDIGGVAERNIVGRAVPNYQDSLKDSNNPNFEADMGRQIAHGLAHVPGFASLGNTNAGVGQIVSGVIDAAFDFKADPLINLGKLASSMREGGFVAEAKVANADGVLESIPHPSGQGMVVAPSMRIAANSDFVNNFFLAHSGVVYNPEQLDMAYNTQGAVKRAVDDIASRTNPAEIARIYKVPDSMAIALANDNTPGKVLGTYGQALYSNQFATLGGQLTSLKLPVRSLAKNFSGDLLQKVRTNSQASTLADTVNLLTPKKNMLFDAQGNPLKDADGNMQYQSVKPVIFGGNMMNALAGKVRNFSTMKGLAFNPRMMKYSGKTINWSDPNTSVAVGDILMGSQPYNIAMEHTARIMLQSTDELKSTAFHDAQMEAIKAGGLPANTQMFNKIVAEGRRALLGNEQKNGIWGYLKGNVIANTLMKPRPESVDANLREEHLASTAILEHQVAGTSMLDYKSMRQAMRATKAYGAMYNKFDDFYTNYTNLIFAPLTLLSMAFGARVAASEAMQQVIRKGLGNYLQSRVAYSAGKYMAERDLVAERVAANADREATVHGLPLSGKANEIPRKPLTEVDHQGITTAVTMGMTDEELNKLGDLADGKTVDDTMHTNGIVKRINNNIQLLNKVKKGAIDLGVNPEKLTDIGDNLGKFKNRIAPVGYVSSKIYKVLPYSITHKADILAERALNQGWFGLDAGVAAEHTAQSNIAVEDETDMLLQTRGHGSKPGEQIHGLSRDDPHFGKYLAINLNQMRNSEIARSISKDYLNLSRTKSFDTMTPDQQWAKVIETHQARIEDPAQFLKARSIVRAMNDAVPSSLAANQVSAVRGLVEGNDGTIHTNWLQHIASNKEMYEADHIKNVPTDQLPMMVTGRVMRPNLKNALQRVESFGFRTFVNPVMNWVSREPLFAHFYYEQYLKLESSIQLGRIDKATAQDMAAQNAIKEMIPVIHNPQLRSQFAVMHRNLLPFYFAQEQAMKRVGRLILSNPQAVREFQMISQGINNPGFVHTDSLGKKFIVYPMLGETGSMLARGLSALGINQFSGLPTDVTGSTSSLITVMPELKVPSVGVFTNMIASDLAKKFPWMEKATSAVTGGHPSQNWMDTIIPNSTVRDIFNGLNMDQRESTVYNATLSAIRAGAYNGDLSFNRVPYEQLTPSQQQQILDKLENNAKSNLFIKGLMAFFLPLSPTVSNDYRTKDEQVLGTEYWNMIDKQGLTYQEAWNRFSQLHGPSSVSYTATANINGLNGAKLPLNDTTLTWLKDNKFLMDNYQQGAAYLVPQGLNGKDALAVDQKLLTMQLRAKRTPQEFLDSIYVSKGWNDINANYQDYQKFLNANQGNRSAIGNAVADWNNYTASYGASNPIWYADYTNKSKTANADLALKDLMTMQGKGILNHPQYSKINNLLNNYKDYSANLAQQIVGGHKTPEYSLLRNQWFNYVDNLANTDTTLTSIVNGVFRRVG